MATTITTRTMINSNDFFLLLVLKTQVLLNYSVKLLLFLVVVIFNLLLIYKVQVSYYLFYH